MCKAQFCYVGSGVGWVFNTAVCVVCVCVVIPFTLDVRLVDPPAGATQEEGHTGFLYLLRCFP